MGPNLAMYESGNIAVNLNKYLKASAERVKTQAEIENLIYKVPSLPTPVFPSFPACFLSRTLRCGR